MEIKRIAITGHSEGIGDATYRHLSSYYEVKGYSRSTGWDISTDAGIEAILEDSLDCEVFINNAYHYDQQTKLARRWTELHNDKAHFIINISSLAADPMFNIEKMMPWLTEYAGEKRRLNQASFDIANRNSDQGLAKSMTLMLGIVDTEFDINEYYKLTNHDQAALHLVEILVKGRRFIRSHDVAVTIKTMIDSIASNCFMYSVSLFNRF